MAYTARFADSSKIKQNDHGPEVISVPSSPKAKRALLLAGVVLVALLLAGFVTGAIGASLFGSESFLGRPEVHLPPQVITGVEVVHSGSEGDHGEEHSGLPRGFVLTNTMLSAWISTAVIIVFFLLATRRMSLIPSRLQNLAEWIVETLHNFVESVAGREYGRKFFPVIATIFLFVAVNAWLELIPIYQSLGFKDEGGNLTTHLLRGAPTDLNFPLALALVSFIFVEYWGIRAHGRKYMKEFLRFDNLLKGRIFTGLIDVFVGFLELLSHVIRIISFTFRLFGNVTAGAILLMVIGFLLPFVALLPFYGLELLVGFIQALIFAGLTLCFVAVAVAPHQEEHS
jgi:F-type H+-transporting ATPase subunit a